MNAPEIAIGLSPVRRAGRSPAPFDAVATSVAAAWGLRQLLTSWSGPLVTLRRSSDGTTLDVAAGTDGWPDIAAVATWCGTASAFVTRWWDQTGLGQHADQAAAAAQPRVINAGTAETIGGRPALYAGTGTLFTATLVAAVAQPASIVTTLQMAATTDANHRRILSGGYNSDLRVDQAGKPHVVFGMDLAYASILSGGAGCVLATGLNGTESVLRVNGAATTGDAGTAGLPAPVTLLNYTTPDRPLIGHTGELAIVSRKLTDTEFVAIERALGAPRGVPLS